MPVFTLYIKKEMLDSHKPRKQRKLLALVKSAMGRAMITHGTHPQQVDVGGYIVRAERSVNCVPYQVVVSITVGGPKGYGPKGTYPLVRLMALQIFRALTSEDMSVEDWSVFCPGYGGGYFSSSDFTLLDLSRE